MGMSEAELHEFCLDWMMNHVPKNELIVQFRDSGMQYETFKDKAQDRGYWAKSMEVLAEFEPYLSGTEQKAKAWDAVCKLLNELDPECFYREGTGLECALRSIRGLANGEIK